MELVSCSNPDGFSLPTNLSERIPDATVPKEMSLIPFSAQYWACPV